MRVLVISNYFPPYEVGGYEQLCRDITVSLGERGHDVYVLTSDWRVAKDGLPLERDVYRELKICPTANSPLGIASQFFLTRRRALKHNRQTLFRTISRTRPDVVFIWNLQGLFYELAVAAEAFPGVAVAYWLAGYTPAEQDVFEQYWSEGPKINSRLGAVKRIIGSVALAQLHQQGELVRPRMRNTAVVSNYMLEKGIETGTLPNQVRIIYNGVETEQFFHSVRRRGDDMLEMLYAGRVSPDKGAHTIIEAMGCLLREYGISDIRLTIAGTGTTEYSNHLLRRIEHHRLQTRVSLTGWISRSDLSGYMSRSHVLLLPSIYPEAFARVVLEGMAAGLATIATPVGGTSEIVRDNDTGLLFPVDNAPFLAMQIRRLEQDDEFRQRLATAGQRLVMKQFGMQQMVDSVEVLLQDARMRQNA